jgi:hypothetical protein
MEPEGLWPHLQEPAICSYPEADQFKDQFDSEIFVTGS